MPPRLIEAKYLRDYTLWVRFTDGTEGEVDLKDELVGEVFEPLRDRAFFTRVQLNPELHALVWPNGADFAPEFIRSAVRVAA